MEKDLNKVFLTIFGMDITIKQILIWCFCVFLEGVVIGFYIASQSQVLKYFLPFSGVCVALLFLYWVQKK